MTVVLLEELLRAGGSYERVGEDERHSNTVSRRMLMRGVLPRRSSYSNLANLWIDSEAESRIVESTTPRGVGIHLELPAPHYDEILKLCQRASHECALQRFRQNSKDVRFHLCWGDADSRPC